MVAAPIAQSRVTGCQDMVVEGALVSVLPAPTEKALLKNALPFQRSVCPVPTARKPPSGCVTTVSTTTSPATTGATVTVGAVGVTFVAVPEAKLDDLRGVVWWTLEKDIAPTTT